MASGPHLRLCELAKWSNEEWVECFNFESLTWILKQSKNFTLAFTSHAEVKELKSNIRSMFPCGLDKEGNLFFRGPKSKLKKSPKIKSSQVLELAEYLVRYIAFIQIEAKLTIASKLVEWSYPS